MEARHRFMRLFLAVAISATSVMMFAQTSQFLPSLKNGDYNGDDARDLTDAINMFLYLFTDRANPPEPVGVDCRTEGSGDGSAVSSPSIQNCDVNGDGSFNLTDCIHFLNWLYNGGQEPIAIDCEVTE